MYHMEDRDSIILAYRREGKSIREIARTHGMSRKTVRKYLRKYEQSVGASATAEEMDAFLREPVCYDSSNRVRRVVTESVRAKIDGFMAKNRANMAAGLRA
jgi:transposase-like protein